MHKIFTNNKNNDDRSTRVKKNVLIIVSIKGISIFITFLIMRASYHYLNASLYGIWLTIFSVVSWFSILDVGIGNGLKNKLSEALALNNKTTGKEIVSTSYIVVGTILFFFMIVYLIVSKYISWVSILNISTSIDESQINSLMKFLIPCFLLIFLFSLINNVALAFQESYVPGIITLLSNSLVLVGIFLIPNTDGSLSLTWFGYLYGNISLLVVLLFSFIFYKFKYYEVKPAILGFNRIHIKELFNLSIKFFILQLCGILIFFVDNIIINRYLGPEQVVSYQSVYKIFSVFLMIHGLIMTPLWSAFTESYVKNDFSWIRATIRKLLIIMIPIIFFLIIVCLLCDRIIDFWFGNNIEVRSSLVLLMALFVFIMMYNNIFAYFLNGISKINIQMMCGITGALINFPLAIYLAVTLQMGISGVVLSTIISLLPSSVLTTVQTILILRRNHM